MRMTIEQREGGANVLVFLTEAEADGMFVQPELHHPERE
jgi:hypothetical protein